ncbi:MAG: RNA polymerase sigma factor, partial [Acidobacteriota bacterium]
SPPRPRDTVHDTQLIQDAKNGSSEALNALFGRYGSKLLMLIRLRMGPSLRNRLESRDVLQQTMLKAYERLEQFGGSGQTSMMAWLGVIARNEIRDQARFFGRGGRDAARDVPLEVASDVADQLRTEVSRLHWMAQAQRLETAIESLDASHREVVLLRRFEELSFSEIGALLDKSPDASRMLYARAMAALTVKLRDLESSPIADGRED